MTQDFGVGTNTAISRNFVMLHALSCGNEADILYLGAGFFRDRLLALFDKTFHGLALFAGCLFPQFFEDLLKPDGMFLGLFEVRLETGFESWGMSGFGHRRQCLDELSFRAVEVLELFNEQLL